jgi:hypothetical protein
MKRLYSDVGINRRKASPHNSGPNRGLRVIWVGGAGTRPVKDSHTRIKPLALALASGHGRHTTVTPERTILSVGEWPLHVAVRYKFVLWPFHYRGFHLDPQLGSREHNAAKNHLNRAPFGLRPLQPVVWGGVYCQLGINPKVTAI